MLLRGPALERGLEVTHEGAILLCQVLICSSGCISGPVLTTLQPPYTCAGRNSLAGKDGKGGKGCLGWPEPWRTKKGN